MIFPTVLPSLFSSPWRQMPSCTSTSSPRTSCHALEASSTTSPSTSPTRTVRASLPTSATAIEESLWCLVLRRTGDESCNLFWRLAFFGFQTNIKNSITGLNLKPSNRNYVKHNRWGFGEEFLCRSWTVEHSSMRADLRGASFSFINPPARWAPG